VLNRNDFDKVKSAAASNKFALNAVGASSITLRSLQPAENIAFEPLERFSELASERYGVDLSVRGGGHGCFELVLGATIEQGDNAGKALGGLFLDRALHEMLDAAQIDYVVTRTPAGRKAYAPIRSISFLFATNRKRSETARGPNFYFTGKFSDLISYGRANFVLHDVSTAKRLSHGPLRRLWRSVKRFIPLGESSLPIEVESMTLLGEEGIPDAFTKAVTEAGRDGVLYFVHGYANGFGASLHSFARLCQQLQADERHLLPVIFSWPSPGKAQRYLRDTSDAMRSETKYVDTLSLLSKALPAAPTHLVAHSHGNHLMVRGLGAHGDLIPTGKVAMLQNIILAAADLDTIVLRDNLSAFKRRGKKFNGRVTVYFSEYDLALSLSESLWGGQRSGVQPKALPMDIDVIDASECSSGIMGHAYHVDSWEVTADMGNVLAGHPPAKRLSTIEPADEHYWRIRRMTV
jgi:esterase/lipase superfamily enzyme